MKLLSLVKHNYDMLRIIVVVLVDIFTEFCAQFIKNSHFINL